jgi:hypothetical protein
VNLPGALLDAAPPGKRQQDHRRSLAVVNRERNEQLARSSSLSSTSTSVTGKLPIVLLQAGVIILQSYKPLPV